MENTELKTCVKCGAAKPLVEFYKRPDRPGYYGTCKPCVCSDRREKYQQDPEKAREKSRAEYRRNSKQKLTRKQRYQIENRERLLQRSKNYYKANPQKFREYRTARRLGETRRLNQPDEVFFQKEFEARAMGMQVDHIIPLKGKLVSGLDVPWNYQLLYPECNKAKRNKFDNDSYQEWRRNGEAGPYLPD